MIKVFSPFITICHFMLINSYVGMPLVGIRNKVFHVTLLGGGYPQGASLQLNNYFRRT